MISYFVFALVCLYVALRLYGEAKMTDDNAIRSAFAGVFYTNSFMFFYMATAIHSGIENYRLLVPAFVLLDIFFVFKYLLRGKSNADL
jgi:hypothetical protein